MKISYLAFWTTYRGESQAQAYDASFEEIRALDEAGWDTVWSGGVPLRTMVASNQKIEEISEAAIGLIFISSEYWLIYEQNFIKIGGISLLIPASAVENACRYPILLADFSE